MNRVVLPGERRGTVRIPSSKSQVHRLLLLAAVGAEPVELRLDGVSRDIAATADCLRALGAEIDLLGEEVIKVTPLGRGSPAQKELDCGESGSTLRFLLPLVGALGVKACFLRRGRLSQRPLSPLDGVLREHGMTLWEEGERLWAEGQLTPGDYTIPGNVSSQYISGLLMALCLLPGESSLWVTGPVESASYVDMTEKALKQAGIRFQKEGWHYCIPGGQRPGLPKVLRAEGDWSNGAFFLALGALSREGITVRGLDPDSAQGDRAMLDLLRSFGARVEMKDGTITVRREELRGITVDAAPIPDLVPPLAVLGALAEGETRIVNAARLRLKESDRLESVAALLRSLGGTLEVQPEGLVIHGGILHGGTVSPWNDHRIAMAAAVAAAGAAGPVTVEDSECVAKSYPRFWEDLASLEGERQ